MKKKTSEIKPIKKTTFAEKPTIIIPHETERKKNYSKTIKIKRSNTLKIKFNMAIRDTNITDETFTLSTLEKNNTNQNNNSKQKTPYQTISEKILGKIYNNNPVIDKKVFYLKKKKGKFSLGNYQKLLLRTCEPGLSKDSIKKLNGAFNKLRNSCRQKFDTDYRFIKDIEDEEEKIINRINVSGNVYVKLMSKSIDFNKTHSSFRNDELNLPKIRFRKVMNKKKYQKYLN